MDFSSVRFRFSEGDHFMIFLGRLRLRWGILIVIYNILLRVVIVIVGHMTYMLSYGGMKRFFIRASVRGRTHT